MILDTINFNVNILGVILVVVASMLIGMLWYSPVLFGKKWMVLVGMMPEIASDVKRNANKAYALMLIPAFVMAFILAVFIKNMFVANLCQALFIGFLAWLGFVATTGSSEYIFNAKPKPWTLYMINVGYQLVNIIVGSCILYFLR